MLPVVNLVGNLTRDVQTSYTPDQTAVGEFGVACNSKYKDKEYTCFLDCTIFGKRADVVNKWFHKGDKIQIVGTIKTDQWQAQDGSKRSKTRLTVTDFGFVGDNKQKPQQEPVPQDDDIPY